MFFLLCVEMRGYVCGPARPSNVGDSPSASAFDMVSEYLFGGRTRSLLRLWCWYAINGVVSDQCGALAPNLDRCWDQSVSEAGRRGAV